MIHRNGGWRAGKPAARRSPDRGSATVELAMGIPVLVLLLLSGLTGVNAVLTELRCVDAAREAARAAARGEPGEAAGRRVAPTGASVVVSVVGDEVRVTVSTRVYPLGDRLPGIDVGASAVAVREPESVQ